MKYHYTFKLTNGDQVEFDSVEAISTRHVGSVKYYTAGYYEDAPKVREDMVVWQTRDEIGEEASSGK